MVGFVGILDFAALFCAFLEWDWDDVPLCVWAAMWDHQLSGAAHFYRTSRAAYLLSTGRPRPSRSWDEGRVQRLALHVWSEVGRRASPMHGLFSGIELRGIVVLFCEWLLRWAGTGAGPAARTLLARSLRWRRVVAGSAEVSFDLIQRTLLTLALEAHHLHRWLCAASGRPRHALLWLVDVLNPLWSLRAYFNGRLRRSSVIKDALLRKCGVASRGIPPRQERCVI